MFLLLEGVMDSLGEVEELDFCASTFPEAGLMVPKCTGSLQEPVKAMVDHSFCNLSYAGHQGNWSIALYIIWRLVFLEHWHNM